MFNAGIGQRKAIYKYFAQGIPSVFTIDAPSCRQLGQGKKCGVCAKTCQAKAIDFEQKDRTVEIEAGAIVMASGYDVFDPSVIPEYGYGRIKNVVTALEFERFLSASGPTAGHLDRPSELALEKEVEATEKEVKKLSGRVKLLEEKQGKNSAEVIEAVKGGESDPALVEWAKQAESLTGLEARLEAMNRKKAASTSAKKLAFIQCVGSRDFRFNKFCSSYCCMHSVKEAMIANEHDRDVHSSIFCMDLRAVGRNFEEYKLRGGLQANIDYVRGRVAEITEDEAKNPIVWYECTTDRQVKSQVSIWWCWHRHACRAPGLSSWRSLPEWSWTQTGSSKQTRSCRSRQRCREFSCADVPQGPMDIPESVAQASSAAACAAEVVIGSPAGLKATA